MAKNHANILKSGRGKTHGKDEAKREFAKRIEAGTKKVSTVRKGEPTKGNGNSLVETEPRAESMGNMATIFESSGSISEKAPGSNDNTLTSVPAPLFSQLADRGSVPQNVQDPQKIRQATANTAVGQQVLSSEDVQFGSHTHGIEPHMEPVSRSSIVASPESQTSTPAPSTILFSDVSQLRQQPPVGFVNPNPPQALIPPALFTPASQTSASAYQGNQGYYTPFGGQSPLYLISGLKQSEMLSPGRSAPQMPPTVMDCRHDMSSVQPLRTSQELESRIHQPELNDPSRRHGQFTLPPPLSTPVPDMFPKPSPLSPGSAFTFDARTYQPPANAPALGYSKMPPCPLEQSSVSSLSSLSPSASLKLSVFDFVPGSRLPPPFLAPDAENVLLRANNNCVPEKSCGFPSYPRNSITNGGITPNVFSNGIAPTSQNYGTLAHGTAGSDAPYYSVPNFFNPTTPTFGFPDPQAVATQTFLSPITPPHNVVSPGASLAAQSFLKPLTGIDGSTVPDVPCALANMGSVTPPRGIAPASARNPSAPGILKPITPPNGVTGLGAPPAPACFPKPVTPPFNIAMTDVSGIPTRFPKPITSPFGVAFPDAPRAPARFPTPLIRPHGVAVPCPQSISPPCFFKPLPNGVAHPDVPCVPARFSKPVTPPFGVAAPDVPFTPTRFPILATPPLDSTILDTPPVTARNFPNPISPPHGPGSITDTAQKLQQKVSNSDSQLPVNRKVSSYSIGHHNNVTFPTAVSCFSVFTFLKIALQSNQ